MTIRDLALLLREINPKTFDKPVFVRLDGPNQNIRSIVAARWNDEHGICFTACNCEKCQTGKEPKEAKQERKS